MFKRIGVHLGAQWKYVLMRKENSHIRISKKLKKKLDEFKIGRETYEDVIWKIPEIKSFWKTASEKKSKKR